MYTVNPITYGVGYFINIVSLYNHDQSLSCLLYMKLDCATFELTNHNAYRVENKSLISTPRKLISTAGKLIFQVRECT